jgi:hypothetical protein
LARAEIVQSNVKQLTELDSLVYKNNNPEFESHLNIPFRIVIMRNLMGIKSCGSNNHTASKPYTYAEVSKYYDLKGINEKNGTSWWARKLWNENTVEIQDGYWLSLKYGSTSR